MPNTELDSISPMDVNRLMIEMKKATTKRKLPYSPKTIRNTLELLNRLFNYARRLGLGLIRKTLA